MTDTTRYLLISGDDTIGRERARSAFIAQLCAQHPGLTEEHFDSSAESFEQYASRMMSPSLFAEMRLFSVRHAQKLADADFAQLAAVISADPPDICLLIEADAPEGGRAAKADAGVKLGFAARVKKNPAVFSLQKFPRPSKYKMAEWLCETVPLLFKRSMGRPAAEALLELTGSDDLSTVYAELTKLDIFLPPGSAIDKPSVESVIGASRRIDPFELAKAVGTRDAARCIELVRALFADEDAAPLYISVLFKHFWKLMKIRGAVELAPDQGRRYFAVQGYGRSEIAHGIFVAAGIMSADSDAKKAYPMVMDQLIDQAKFYKAAHLRRIFSWLAEYDAGVKTGRVVASSDTFELLCYRIMRVGELSMVTGAL